MERRLSTVLCADVAGYSRLMGVDEEGTLSTLKKSRQIVDRVVVSQRGRVFGGAGDSVVRIECIDGKSRALVRARTCAAGLSRGEPCAMLNVFTPALMFPVCAPEKS